MNTTSVAQFCSFAQSIAHACSVLQLVSPGFRSPPSSSSASRTIRRYRQDGTIVSVRLHGRDPGVVLADMVDGVLAANEVELSRRDALRRRLLALITPSAESSAA